VPLFLCCVVLLACNMCRNVFVSCVQRLAFIDPSGQGCCAGGTFSILVHYGSSNTAFSPMPACMFMFTSNKCGSITPPYLPVTSVAVGRQLCRLKQFRKPRTQKHAGGSALHLLAASWQWAGFVGICSIVAN
jgi:hypothetical protein